SWLSREIIFLTGFGAAATTYAAMSFLNLPAANIVGALATKLGLCGITATSLLYLVPGRPAWRTPHTVVEFVLAGIVLGPLFIAALGVSSSRMLLIVAIAAAAQLINHVWKFGALASSDEFEKQASARLLGQ